MILKTEDIHPPKTEESVQIEPRISIDSLRKNV